MILRIISELIRFTVLVVFLSGTGTASDISVKIFPNPLSPGDAFLVEVKSMDIPSGEFDGRPIHFFRVSNGLYHAISSVREDAGPGKYPLTLTAGGASFRHKLTVREKKSRIQQLTLNPEKVFLSPQDEDRVKKENIRLSALWGKLTEPVWEGKFTPPLDTPVSTPFGVVRIINHKKRSLHRGVDYKARSGESIRAVNSGMVVLADELFYGGKTVMVNHGSGVYSIYMHLSEFMVQEGQRVKKGATIGLVGSTGRVTGPHLHISVKVQEMSVNPESLFSLPLSGYRRID